MNITVAFTSCTLNVDRNRRGPCSSSPLLACGLCRCATARCARSSQPSRRTGMCSSKPPGSRSQILNSQTSTHALHTPADLPQISGGQRDLAVKPLRSLESAMCLMLGMWVWFAGCARASAAGAQRRAGKRHRVSVRRARGTETRSRRRRRSRRKRR